MPPLFVQQVKLRFGEGRVIDVLAGTGLEDHARSKDYGIFVIRDVLDREERRSWEAGLDQMFEEVRLERGIN